MHLIEHGLVTVTEIDGDKSRREVGIALPVGVVHVDALAADDYRNVQVRLGDPRGQHVFSVEGFQVVGGDHGVLQMDKSRNKEDYRAFVSFLR